MRSGEHALWDAALAELQAYAIPDPMERLRRHLVKASADIVASMRRVAAAGIPAREALRRMSENTRRL